MTASTTADLVIRGGIVARPRQQPVASDISIRDGRISAILEPGTPVDAREVLDATGLTILPGVVDGHTHLGAGNGLDEYGTETGAAALGGVTTMFNILASGGSYDGMLAEHLESATTQSRIDFGFHLTLMTPEHLAELPALRERYGVGVYKYFMHFRGDEGKYLGVEGTDDGKMYQIFGDVSELDDLLFVHAENPEVVSFLREGLQRAGRDDLAAWDDARPPYVEAEAVRRVAYLANELGTRVYLVHISSRESLEQIRTARAQFPNLDMSVETCPHYLTHTVDFSEGIVGKVNPPLRRPDQVEPIWEAIADGTVDTVASDHVSRKRATKDGSIWSASAGFPGSPTILPVLLTHGHLERGIPLGRIAEVASARPAELLGLERKGDISVGFDADLTLVDLENERVADPEWLGTNSDYSIYAEQPLRGWARHTFVRGAHVVKDYELIAAPGTGRYVRGKENA